MKSVIFTGFLVLLVIVDVVHGSSEPTSYRGCIDVCSDRYDICRSTCVGKKARERIVRNIIQDLSSVVPDMRTAMTVAVSVDSGRRLFAGRTGYINTYVMQLGGALFAK
ncbi:hypothetical protein LSAT2_021735 [Lamellibrachia satsuma]|nr:hypothetical protein LSAT2_021735 [Lamellibrachia satsuma]